MKKFLVIRHYNDKDYLYSILRANNIDMASEKIEEKIIMTEFKDHGVYTVTPLVSFHYKGNRVILPDGVKKTTIVIPSVDTNPFEFLKEHLKQ
ncbi:hypothetical protein WMO40_21110 [Bacillaceae bacterium CLA-AA-H227]|uniref:Uncharacterized protein n=1 Tax=Robertmurraya yapensis (ex Hitch et al 2024) TaxID=3133160 RepID=A0ACC6SH54_9BACI